MKKLNIIFLLFTTLFLFSCNTRSLVDSTHNKEYIGNVVASMYINGTTYIVINEHTLFVKGKIKNLEIGTKCYLINEYPHEFLLYDGCNEKLTITH